MTALDYGIVLLLLDEQTGEARPLYGDDRLRSPALRSARSVAVPPPVGGTVDTVVRLSDPPHLSRAERLWARAALVRALRYGRRLDLLQNKLSRLFAQATRAASLAEAEQAVAAVRAVARTLPVGIRPFTEPAAAAFGLARHGLGVEFRHGATIDPVAVRSWLEVDGVPVAEPAWIDRYTAFAPIHP